jgi:hypothetical protein
MTHGFWIAKYRPNPAGAKIMSKNVNLNPFKTVTLILLAFVVLLANGVVGCAATEKISAILPDGFYFETDVPCTSYSTTSTSNNVFTNNVNSKTGEKERLAYNDINNKNFPIIIPVVGMSLSISAADVDRLFDTAYLSAGYTKLPDSTASLAMNCHGYATGKSVWLTEFRTSDKLGYHMSSHRFL